MAERSTSDRGLRLLEDAEWQMSFGDRAALEGVLCTVRPRLAIEVGTAQGGSMRRIAARSEAVHALDITFDLLVGERPENVTFHEGSSHTELPSLLDRLAAENRNVDFVLIDGDHRPEGVAADIQAVIDSPATARTVVMVHDSFHPWVRHGIGRVSMAHPKVRHFELDFVPGRVTLDPFDGELWGGFALLTLGPGPASPPEIRIRHVEVDERLEFADAWETAVRAAPLIESIRSEDEPRTVRSRLADRLRRRR